MAAQFEIFKDAKEEFRWLRAVNGVVIATSGEGYETKAGVTNGIDAVRRDAPTAQIDDHT